MNRVPVPPWRGLLQRKTDRLALVGHIARCFSRASKKTGFPHWVNVAPSAEFGSGPFMYGYFHPGGLGILLGAAPFDSMLGLARSVAG